MGCKSSLNEENLVSEPGDRLFGTAKPVTQRKVVPSCGGTKGSVQHRWWMEAQVSQAPPAERGPPPPPLMVCAWEPIVIIFLGLQQLQALSRRCILFFLAGSLVFPLGHLRLGGTRLPNLERRGAMLAPILGGGRPMERCACSVAEHFGRASFSFEVSSVGGALPGWGKSPTLHV